MKRPVDPYADLAQVYAEETDPNRALQAGQPTKKTPTDTLDERDN